MKKKEESMTTQEWIAMNSKMQGQALVKVALASILLGHLSGVALELAVAVVSRIVPVLKMSLKNSKASLVWVKKIIQKVQKVERLKERMS
jgi:hypothetical protein